MPVALFPREAVAGIAKGAYTEIVAIDAPSSAIAGSRVDVTIRIKNLWTDYVHVSAIGVWDSEERFIDWLDYWIPPGSTHSFPGSFIMPDRDVTIHANSYFEAADGYWYFDDEDEKDVKLGEVVGWQLLDTRLAGVGTVLPEVGWQLLDSRTIAVKSVPPVVGWQLLDSRTIAVKSVPPVVGWQLLDEKAVGLTAGLPEVPYELIQHTISHFAYIYDGDVEVNIATFKIDPFTPSVWAAKKFADALESEARKKGARVLETKVYVDTTPLLWTNIRIEVTGTPLGEEVETVAGRGIAVGIAPWLAIILVCLAIIAVIIVVTLAFDHWMEAFKKKPGLEDMKPTWGKEALILDIQDTEGWLEQEGRLEQPVTPTETLEEMSEEELRDHLDELAKKVVPPVTDEWLPLILLGVLGVGGLGAIAVAYALTKPEYP